MSVRQQIRDRIIVELNTDRPSDIPEATKRRYVPGTQLTDPMIGVFFGRKETAAPATNRHSPLRQRELYVAVQCVDAVEEPDQVDDATEAMLEWIVNVLGDSNLNGLAHDIEEVETVWELEYRDLIYCSATIYWRVRYQTLKDDLTAKQ